MVSRAQMIMIYVLTTDASLSCPRMAADFIIPPFSPD